MAWTESHQALLDHRKTLRFARELGVSQVTAIGHLHIFWWWALDNAPSGILTHIEDQDIAEVVRYSGLTQQPVENDLSIHRNSIGFLQALIKAGFVDKKSQGKGRRPTLQIHDWGEYGGKLLQARAAHKERTRRSRASLEERRGEERRSDPPTTALADPDFARLQAHYEQVSGLALTPTQANALADLAEEFSLEDVLAATTEAARCSKSDPRYIAAIVRRWAVEGRQPRKGAKREEVKRNTDEAGLERYCVDNWKLLGFASRADAERAAVAGN